MAEKKVQKTKVQSDYLSDSKSSEDKVNPYLCTSREERVYGGKRTTETTQDKETFQRTGSRQTYTD